jgi:predicted transposase YbfD/YdcC
MGCHFLVQVKRNCRKVWETIAFFTALTQPFSSCEYYEDHHGYQVHRRVELYFNKVQLPKGWNGVERIVKVRRWGKRNEKHFDEVSFYLLSKPIFSAYTVAMAIQQHWSIENKLHWIKDVNLGEDNMTITKPSEAAILAFLNNTAYNVLRQAGYKPTKDTLAKFSNKVNELIHLFKET